MDLSDVIGKFPDELKEPIIALVEVMRKEDMRELREEVERGFRELTTAQKRTEERIEELITAQKRTQEILLKHEERLTNLEKAVEELTTAQKRTEERIEELITAQKRTEENLNKLIKEHSKTREKVENLSHNFGFLLEDRAIQSLPEILKERGMEVKGRLRTKRMIHEGKEYEFNIYGVVKRESRKLILVGECKNRISKKEINRFMKVISRLKERLMEEEKAEEIYPIVVVHRLNTEIEMYLKNLGIDFVESYLLRI